jgi:hypothetical protein
MLNAKGSGLTLKHIFSVKPAHTTPVKKNARLISPYLFAKDSRNISEIIEEL